MAALQIAFHALGTKHSLVKRKILPRLKSDNAVVSDLQLNSALLPTEAAVGLDQFFCGVNRFILPPTWRLIVEVRPEPLFQRLFGKRDPSHGIPLSVATAQATRIYVCRRGTIPANLRS